MTNTTQKARNAVATATAGLMTLVGTANAADMPHGSIETMFGDNKMTLDTKVSAKLSEKVGAFGRCVTTTDYNANSVVPFAFIDLSYSLGNGVNAVYETQFINLPNSTLITPRLGLEYFKQTGKYFSLYTIGTVNIPTEKDPVANGEIVFSLNYTPKLGNHSKLHYVVGAETVTNFGKEGLNFATQNFRLGVGNKSLEGGLAVNLSETPSSFNQTIGGFLSYKF